MKVLFAEDTYVEVSPSDRGVEFYVCGETSCAGLVISHEAALKLAHEIIRICEARKAAP